MDDPVGQGPQLIEGENCKNGKWSSHDQGEQQLWKEEADCDDVIYVGVTFGCADWFRQMNI